MTNTAQRPLSYDAIDVFKFIAATMVVALHTRPFIELGVWDYYFSCLFRIAVPFFFTFSSFIFYKKGKRIGDYVKRMLILYACWFVIELPLIINNFFIIPDKPIIEKLLIFLRGLLINSTFPASWFITASWQGMLIVYLLSKRFDWKGLFIIGLICYLSSLPGTMYYGLISGTPVYKLYWYGYNIILCPANSFITAIPFIVIGKYLAEKDVTIEKGQNLLLLFLALCIGILEVVLCRDSYYMNDTYFSLLLFCPLLVLLLLNSTVRIPDSVCRFLRKSSILIYILHLPVFTLLQRFLQLAYGGHAFILTLLISVLISSIIITLSKRITILKYLY